MKPTYILLSFLAFIFVSNRKAFSADLNFKETIYFTAPDSTSLPGTVLTNSGVNLSSFNFDNAPSTHPMFKSGVYFSVTDCQSHNLWVKFRHIAADPNGRNFGANVAATTGPMFTGGPTMIGGFSGFLYQIDIYRDQNLTGIRTNVLGPLYPTTVTVASLETLAYPGSPHEWLAFQIQNSNSSGWNLNSINFTGSNPNSHPGFAARPVNVSPGNQATYLPLFSEQFPTGRDSIYAIALPIGGYAEFKMTANQVSRFQYGYEFSTYGYQGMSMAFGEGPVLKDSLVNEICYGSGGSIYLKPLGLGPYIYNWSNGNTLQNLINAAPDTYSVTVTDGGGCTSQVSKTILPGPVFTNVLAQTLLSGDTSVIISTTVTGGVTPLTFLWNTGSNNDSLWADSNGIYTLTVKDANNCLAKDTILVSQLVGIEKILTQNGFLLYPNPNKGKAFMRFSEVGEGSLRIMDLNGREIWRNKIKRQESQVDLDLEAIPAGVYTLFFETKGRAFQVKMVKE